ncbi:MAG: stalk domain-containing protein [Bacillota bacterium]
MSKRKKIFTALLTLLITLVGFMNCALSEQPSINVVIDGKRIHFKNAPRLIENSTMVPMKMIFEELGAEVIWSGTDRTVTAKKGDTEILLKIDSSIAEVNKKAVTLDTEACIINNSTFVPVRFVSESLGCIVAWDPGTQTVIINSQDSAVGIQTEAGVFPKANDIFSFDPSLHLNDSYVSKSHTTVIGGGSVLESEDESEKKDYKYNLEIVHNYGIKYMGWLSTIGGLHLKGKDEPFADATCIDIDRNIIENIYKGNNHHCSNNPKWRDYLYNTAKKSIELGADGITFDEWVGTYGTVSDETNGCFCKYCIEGFNDFLKTRYNDKELLALGIESIDDFDYGEYIRRNFYDEYKVPSNRWSGKIPLFKDFEYYQLKSITTFYSNFISSMKSYFKNLGKEIYFSANMANLYPDNLALAEYIDFISPEIDFEYPKYHRTTPYYKLGLSLGKPVYSYPNSYYNTKMMIRDDMTELMILYTAESYAAGGFLNVPYHAAYLDEKMQGSYFPIFADMDKMKPYYDFIKNNRLFYDNISSNADLAVVYSYPTASSWDKMKHLENYIGICNLVGDMHMQYNVVFAGDNDFIKDRLLPENIKGYRSLILPSVSCLSDEQLNTLLSFAEAGGTILAFGETGIKDENGNVKKRDSLSRILVEGNRQYGSGRIIYIEDEIGCEYYKSNTLEGRDSIAGFIKDLCGSEIYTDTDDKVNFHEYWSNNNNTKLIHVVNYDYDIYSKKINKKNNIRVEVPIEKSLLGKYLDVYYTAPDSNGLIKLDFNIENGSVCLEVPELAYYGVIIVGEKNRFLSSWKLENLRNMLDARGFSEDADLLEAIESAEAELSNKEYSKACTAIDAIFYLLNNKYARKEIDRAKALLADWIDSGRLKEQQKYLEKASLSEAAHSSGEYEKAYCHAEELIEMLTPDIDGNMNEWKNIKLLSEDKVGDSKDQNSDILGIYAFTDIENLYISIITKSEMPDAGINIDFNGDGVKEYFVGCGTVDGIKRGLIWKSISAGEDSPKGEVEFAFGDVMEIMIPLSKLEYPGNIYLNIFFNGYGNYKGIVSDEVEGWHLVL